MILYSEKLNVILKLILLCYVMLCPLDDIVDCHTKVHKEHYDKNEEFVAPCKGKPCFNCCITC